MSSISPTSLQSCNYLTFEKVMPCIEECSRLMFEQNDWEGALAVARAIPEQFQFSVSCWYEQIAIHFALQKNKELARKSIDSMDTRCKKAQALQAVVLKLVDKHEWSEAYRWVQHAETAEEKAACLLAILEALDPSAFKVQLDPSEEDQNLKEASRASLEELKATLNASNPLERSLSLLEKMKGFSCFGAAAELVRESLRNEIVAVCDQKAEQPSPSWVKM